MVSKTEDEKIEEIKRQLKDLDIALDDFIDYIEDSSYEYDNTNSW